MFSLFPGPRTQNLVPLFAGAALRLRSAQALVANDFKQWNNAGITATVQVRITSYFISSLL